VKEHVSLYVLQAHWLIVPEVVFYLTKIYVLVVANVLMLVLLALFIMTSMITGQLSVNIAAYVHVFVHMSA
jgi:hypothetical protein